ncbi:hypothetical protein HKX48_002578 [Thoreauomyces humboldtii]|nr:hypothetical protein HKX48_002578 [Thoreauomyces humboldtii]
MALEHQQVVARAAVLAVAAAVGIGLYFFLRSNNASTPPKPPAPQHPGKKVIEERPVLEFRKSVHFEDRPKIDSNVIVPAPVLSTPTSSAGAVDGTLAPMPLPAQPKKESAKSTREVPKTSLPEKAAGSIQKLDDALNAVNDVKPATLKEVAKPLTAASSQGAQQTKPAAEKLVPPPATETSTAGAEQAKSQEKLRDIIPTQKPKVETEAKAEAEHLTRPVAVNGKNPEKPTPAALPPSTAETDAAKAALTSAEKAGHAKEKAGHAKETRPSVLEKKSVSGAAEKTKKPVADKDVVPSVVAAAIAAAVPASSLSAKSSNKADVNKSPDFVPKHTGGKDTGITSSASKIEKPIKSHQPAVSYAAVAEHAIETPQLDVKQPAKTAAKQSDPISTLVEKVGAEPVSFSYAAVAKEAVDVPPQPSVKSKVPIARSKSKEALHGPPVASLPKSITPKAEDIGPVQSAAFSYAAVAKEPPATEPRKETPLKTRSPQSEPSPVEPVPVITPGAFSYAAVAQDTGSKPDLSLHKAASRTDLSTSAAKSESALKKTASKTDLGTEKSGSAAKPESSLRKTASRTELATEKVGKDTSKHTVAKKDLVTEVTKPVTKKEATVKKAASKADLNTETSSTESTVKKAVSKKDLSVEAAKSVASADLAVKKAASKTDLDVEASKPAKASNSPAVQKTVANNDVSAAEAAMPTPAPNTDLAMKKAGSKEIVKAETSKPTPVAKNASVAEPVTRSPHLEKKSASKKKSAEALRDVSLRGDGQPTAQASQVATKVAGDGNFTELSNKPADNIPMLAKNAVSPALVVEPPTDHQKAQEADFVSGTKKNGKSSVFGSSNGVTPILNGKASSTSLRSSSLASSSHLHADAPAFIPGALHADTPAFVPSTLRVPKPPSPTISTTSVLSVDAPVFVPTLRVPSPTKSSASALSVDAAEFVPGGGLGSPTKSSMSNLSAEAPEFVPSSRRQSTVGESRLSVNAPEFIPSGLGVPLTVPSTNGHPTAPSSTKSGRNKKGEKTASSSAPVAPAPTIADFVAKAAGTPSTTRRSDVRAKPNGKCIFGDACANKDNCGYLHTKAELCQ